MPLPRCVTQARHPSHQTTTPVIQYAQHQHGYQYPVLTIKLMNF